MCFAGKRSYREVPTSRRLLHRSAALSNAAAQGARAAHAGPLHLYHRGQQGGDQGGHHGALPRHEGVGPGALRGCGAEDPAARVLDLSVPHRETQSLPLPGIYLFQCLDSSLKQIFCS